MIGRVTLSITRPTANTAPSLVIAQYAPRPSPRYCHSCVGMLNTLNIFHYNHLINLL